MGGVGGCGLRRADRWCLPCQFIPLPLTRLRKAPGSPEPFLLGGLGASRDLHRTCLLHEASQALPGLHFRAQDPVAPGSTALFYWHCLKAAKSSSSLSTSLPPGSTSALQSTPPFLVLCLSTLGNSLEPKDKALTRPPLQPQGPSGAITPPSLAAPLAALLPAQAGAPSSILSSVPYA